VIVGAIVRHDVAGLVGPARRSIHHRRDPHCAPDGTHTRPAFPKSSTAVAMPDGHTSRRFKLLSTKQLSLTMVNSRLPPAAAQPQRGRAREPNPHAQDLSRARWYDRTSFE
jgi:hypothetical protein